MSTNMTEGLSPTEEKPSCKVDGTELTIRQYQTKLIEVAEQNNTIIFLPTGSGKTYIAIQILKYKGEELKKNISEGGKRSFFLVNTKALVFQQAEVLSDMTGFTIGQYIGDYNVDDWSQARWDAELEQNQVLVMTAQILLNMLVRRNILLLNINVLIFDECHHGVNDHPYRKIMQMFQEVPKENRPLVIGLSATLLNCNVKADAVDKTVKELETTFHAKIATCDELAEVLQYSTNPKETVIYYAVEDKVRHPVIVIYERAIEAINKVQFPSDNKNSTERNNIPDGYFFYGKSDPNRKRAKNAFEDALLQYETLGAYCGAIAALYYIIQFEKMKLSTENETEIELFTYIVTILNMIRRLLMRFMPHDEDVTSVMRFSSAKINGLITYMQEYEKANDDIACIVFVERRSTAVILAHMFRRLSRAGKGFRKIRSDFVIGRKETASFGTRESLLEEVKKEDIVKRFAKGELNLLVATDVIEEGIDLRACNLVIKFDPPKDYRSYVQSKGRARNNTSQFVMFVPADKSTEFDRIINDYNCNERVLKRLLIGRSQEREVPDDETIQKGLYESEVPPFYLDGPDSAYVTGESAITCVDTYCSSLPQDWYSNLSPLCYIKKKAGINDRNEKFTAIVQLPMECPLRGNFPSGVVSSAKNAKKSAYMNIVKLLYELGEINADLKPRKFVFDLKDFKELFPHYKDEKTDEKLPPPGTRKRTRTYDSKYADCLSRCLPEAGVTLYLHVIEVTPKYPIPEDRRRFAFYELLGGTNTFAILSTKKLNRICEFPIFMSAGQIDINLLVNSSTVEMTDNELACVKNFHFNVFEKMVQVVKESFIFDKLNEEQSYYVVPVERLEDGSYVVIWDVITKPAEFPTKLELTEDERRSLIVNSDNYGSSVVTPYYRGSLNFTNYYIVSAVCEEMSPFSPFPTDDYPDYYSYFKQKYGKEIVNLTQPLLEVKSIPKKINYIRPRSTNTTGGIKSRRKKQEQNDEFEEHLVPELCHQMPYSAWIWLKATLLPTVLHRIECIYLIDEFRMKTARRTGLGFVDLPEGKSWAPLRVDQACLKAQDETTDDISGFSRLTVNSKPAVPKMPSANLWDNDEEPVDLERHMEEIAPVDLTNYVNFVQKPLKIPTPDDITLNQDGEQNNNIMTTLNLIPKLDITVYKKNNPGPELVDFVQAFTTKSANDIVNLERKETLGDSFLKFATSLYLFRKLKYDEGKLTVIKGKIIGNRNLYYCGVDEDLPSIINVNEFVPLSDWKPPLFGLPKRLKDGINRNDLAAGCISHFVVSLEEQFTGDLTPFTMSCIDSILSKTEPKKDVSTLEVFLSKKTISDKTIADCVEALIGVYIKSCGVYGGFRFLNCFEILPPADASYESLIESRYDYPIERNSSLQQVLSHLRRAGYQDLERDLDYAFNDKALLLQALTHPSYMRNRITDSYQKLEFLGDAVLDFLITSYIYDYCGDLTPGELTDLRSALVNNVTFACLSVRNNFHKYILALSAPLLNAIENFVKFQRQRNHVVDDAVLILLEEEDCRMSESVEVPKALGDIFESLAGAIFLDSGNNLEEVWRVYYPLMKREIDAFTKKIPRQARRLLMEMAKHKPIIRDVKVTPNGVVFVRLEVIHNNQSFSFDGFGPNKVNALTSASKHALKALFEA